MTCNTSAAAAWRSFASFSSPVRISICVCSSATDGAAVDTLRGDTLRDDTLRDDTLRLLGLFARRALTGRSLPPLRPISLPQAGHDARSYANPGSCAMAGSSLRVIFDRLCGLRLRND